jgi:hypothetical protein
VHAVEHGHAYATVLPLPALPALPPGGPGGPGAGGAGGRVRVLQQLAAVVQPLSVRVVEERQRLAGEPHRARRAANEIPQQ